MKYNSKEALIARNISLYFLEKKIEEKEAQEESDFIDCIFETNEFLKKLDIFGISIEPYKDSKNSKEFDIEVCIELGRPGFLIGEKGKTINQLQTYLSEKLKEKIYLSVKENDFHDFLYVHMYDGTEEDFTGSVEEYDYCNYSNLIEE